MFPTFQQFEPLTDLHSVCRLPIFSERTPCPLLLLLRQKIEFLFLDGEMMMESGKKKVSIKISILSMKGLQRLVPLRKTNG